jgi:hypothetical protein
VREETFNPIPISTSVDDFHTSNKSSQEYNGYNTYPARPVSIDKSNSLTLNPFAKEGGVWMNLNGNDKLYVDASSADQTNITFQRGNGQAELKLKLLKTGIVYFEYTNDFGETYKTFKPVGDFAIANLVHDEEGKLKETLKKDDVNFAVYRSDDTKGSATVEVPSLNLKLTINVFDELTCKDENT